MAYGINISTCCCCCCRRARFTFQFKIQKRLRLFGLFDSSWSSTEYVRVCIVCVCVLVLFRVVAWAFFNVFVNIIATTPITDCLRDFNRFVVKCEIWAEPIPPRGGEESLSGEICAAQALLCPWLFFFFFFFFWKGVQREGGGVATIIRHSFWV